MTNELLDEGIAYAKLGHVAEYIPQLSYVHSIVLGVCIRCPDESLF